MNKLTPYVLIVAVISFLTCQTGQGSQSKDCEQGKERAKEDIQANRLGLYFFGLPNARHNLRVKMISEKLNVAIKGGGDIVTEEGNCYNEVMEKQIRKVHGEDVFKRIDGTIDSLYAIGKGDRELTYKGSESAINQFIVCNLNYLDVKPSDSLKPSVFVKLTISETGTIEKSEIVKGASDKFNNEAIRVANLLKDWEPAIENSVAVKSTFTLRVLFDPSKKNGKICK